MLRRARRRKGGRLGGTATDRSPPASSVCSQEAPFLPDSAPRQRARQLFRSPFSLEAALKNKLLMGVLKRSVASSSTYFFFPCFAEGEEEVGTRGVKAHAAETRHSQPEGKTGAAFLSGCLASNTVPTRGAVARDHSQRRTKFGNPGCAKRRGGGLIGHFL